MTTEHPTWSTESIKGPLSKVYELAKKRGLGREIPTEWFTQSLHT